jgi:hypothetical protein
MDISKPVKISPDGQLIAINYPSGCKTFFLRAIYQRQYAHHDDLLKEVASNTGRHKRALWCDVESNV